MSPPQRLSRRAALPALASVLAAPPGARAQPAGPSVVASFSILGDMALQIAREAGGAAAAPLRVLAGPETDAHTFQPRPSDAEAVRGAALAVRNGLGFEPWFDRLLRGAGFRGVVATASDGVETIRAAHGGGADAPDPHAWQDAGRARVYATRIGDGLAKADPPRAAAWRDAAAAYAARLDALDRHLRARVAEVPPERRVAVTSHGAFGYFGAAYGVRFLAPQAAAAGGQPSAAQVAALVRQMRAERVSAVFFDGPGGRALAESLARETGARPPRGRLYADTLSAPDGPAPTYEAMQRHNVDLLVAGMRDSAA